MRWKYVFLQTLCILAACAALAACFNPRIDEGIACNERQGCPPGMACETASNTCYYALPDAATVPDGPDCTNQACFGLVGAGDRYQPRRWEDNTYAASCYDYLNPQPPYVYEGATGDGLYFIQPTPGAEPLVLACDMTTDGGGFTGVIVWDRESDAGLHRLTTLQAEFADEIAELADATISTMTDLVEGPTDVQWADVNATFDALAYRRDIEIPNRGELRLDIHYDGISMEQSGTWIFVFAAGAATDLMCRSDAKPGAGYSAAELALIPYACPLGIASSESFTWNTVEQRSLGAPITAFHLRSLHGDSNADRSHLYRLKLWIR